MPKKKKTQKPEPKTVPGENAAEEPVEEPVESMSSELEYEDINAEDLIRFIGPREIEPYDNSSVLSTRFHMRESYACDDWFHLCDETGKDLGYIADIRLGDVWNKVKRYDADPTYLRHGAMSTDAKLTEKYGLTYDEWEDVRKKLVKHIESDEFYNAYREIYLYAREKHLYGDDEKPILLQEVWCIRDIEFLQLFMHKAANAIKLMTAAIHAEIAENKAIEARWNKIKKYPHKVSLEQANGGIFSREDAEILRKHGVRYLNDLRARGIYWLKNLFLSHSYESLPEEINAAFKEDHRRRLDFRLRLWPFVAGAVSLVTASIIGYIYQYTLLKNTPMTVLIIFLLAGWATCVGVIVYGAIRAKKRRRTKRPNYYYFTRQTVLSLIGVALLTIATFTSTSIFYERYDGYDDQVYYRNLGNNRITVAGLFDESITDLRLPSSIDGKRVVAVSEHAFSGDDVVRIVIPDSVTYLPEEVFYECEKLQEVELSANIKTIPKSAFENCKKLKTCAIPDSVVNINARAFYGCSALEVADISDSVTYIGDEAFYGCRKMKLAGAAPSVKTVGTSAFEKCATLDAVAFQKLEKVGDRAFYGCAALKDIPQASTLKTIGNRAFSNCKSLTNVTVGNIDRIGKSIFDGCSKLETLTVPYIGPNISDPRKYTYLGNFALKYLTVTAQANFCDETFAGSKLTEVTIGNSSAVIGVGLFDGCTELTTATLPFVTALPPRTFKNDRALTDIYGINYAVEAGDEAFYGCAVLRAEEFLPQFDIIGNRAFAKCEAIQSVELNMIAQLGTGAFEGCSSMTRLTLSDEIPELPDRAFASCKALESVSDHAGLTTIGKETFADCVKLDAFDFADVISIGARAFDNCIAITEVALPSTLETLDESVFRNCTGITSMRVPFVGKSPDRRDMPFSYILPITKTATGTSAVRLVIAGVDKVYANSFSNNKQIVSVVLSDSVKKIEKNAFKGASNLSSIEIPSGVHTIGESAFEGCETLKQLTVPTSLAEIKKRVFKDCKSLPSITVPDYVTSIEESAFENSGISTLELGNGVRIIGKNAFYGCPNLSSVEFGGNLAEFGDGVFGNTQSLKTIDIPATVERMGKGMFEKNKSMSAVTVPFVGQSADKPNAYTYLFDKDASLQSLGITAARDIQKRAFVGLKGLSSVSLVGVGGTIGDNAFEGERSLVKVILPENMTAIGNGVFKNCEYLTVVDGFSNLTSVGDEAFASCKHLDGENTNFDALETIGRSAFYDCKQLVNIDLRSVKKMGIGAFENCTGVSSVTIGDGLTAIPDRAFRSDENLKSVSGYSAVKTIGKSAFAKCRSLTVFEVASATETIDDGAFAECAAFTSVEINDSVTKIGKDVFDKCDNITDISVPFIGKTRKESGKYTVKYILPSASNEKKGLTVTITDTDKIYAGSFKNCRGIVKVVISCDLSAIEKGAFNGATRLKTIEFADGVREICDDAFRNCSTLSVIELPNTLEVIGKSAFRKCGALSSIVIPDSVREIGANAFRESGLGQITFGAGVKTIGDSAFYGCTSITDIALNSGIERIGKDAFRYCNHLRTAVVPDSVKNLSSGIFFDCTLLSSLSLPYLGSDGKTNKALSYFVNKINTGFHATLTIAVTSASAIGDKAFMNCRFIKEVDICGSVSSIGRGAFDGCTGLRTVRMPLHLSDYNYMFGEQVEVIYG